jgi:hypothetical protein
MREGASLCRGEHSQNVVAMGPCILYTLFRAHYADQLLKGGHSLQAFKLTTSPSCDPRICYPVGEVLGLVGRTGHLLTSLFVTAATE